MLRITFLYNHFNTFGHAARVFAIAQRLKERLKERVELTIIQEGARRQLYPFGRYGKIVYRPYTWDAQQRALKTADSLYAALQKTGEISRALVVRQRSLQEVLRQSRPRVLFTEYYPFGVTVLDRALVHLLVPLKKAYSTKIIGSAGYPFFSKESIDIVRQAYDGILVHCPQSFFNEYIRHPLFPVSGRTAMTAIKAYLKDRMSCTGYAVDRQEIKKRGAMPLRLSRREKVVLVSRGSGILHDKLIAVALAAARKMPYYFCIAFGPQGDRVQFDRYRQIIRRQPRVRLQRLLSPAFQAWLRRADVSVNMAGYTTVAEVLYSRKPSVLIPRHTEEQRIRADILHKRYGYPVVEYPHLTVQTLQESIERSLANKGAQIVDAEDDFSGVERTVHYLTHL